MAKRNTNVLPQPLAVENECMREFRASVNSHLHGVLSKLSEKQIEEAKVSITISIKAEQDEEEVGVYRPQIAYKVTSAYQEKYENKGDIANATSDLYYSDLHGWMLRDHRDGQMTVDDFDEEE